jgi:hypothetical protein
MASFIHKYYSIFFILFLGAIVGLSFYLGYEQGSSTPKIDSNGNNAIVFSCPNTVLDKQKITSNNIISSSNEENSLTASATSVTSNTQGSGVYVGSKNGKKYYTPGCSGTNRIKPENYVWFQSVEDATLQGYSKGSC